MKNKQSLANFVGKKVLIIMGVILFLLVGGFIFSKQKTDKETFIDSSQNKKDLFTSVKDALAQKLTLSCEFTDETGAAIKSYIKNGAVRVSSAGNDQQENEIIIQDSKIYIWDDKKKQGFVYSGTTNEDIISNEAYFEMIDKYKDSCKIATVADSYFIVPTDVSFQDMSKLLQDLQK